MSSAIRMLGRISGVVAGMALIGALGISGVLGQTDRVEGLVAEGERLVHNMDCNVCHTPKVMTERGPQPDPERLLSGHPADEPIPDRSAGWHDAGWGGFFSAGLTAWAGPWGVSFASNLTPDVENGIGGWTEAEFVETMRSGRFLPPMPNYDRLTDAELHAIFLYLRSLEPAANAVPVARPPD